MATSSHPHVVSAKRAEAPRTLRAMVCVTDQRRLRWVERELGTEKIPVHYLTRATELFAVLRGEGPPPQLLVIDLDTVSPAELLELHAIREGWFGRILAIGNVPPSLRSSLGIERALSSLVEGWLRSAIRENCDAQTRRIPVVPA